MNKKDEVSDEEWAKRITDMWKNKHTYGEGKDKNDEVGCSFCKKLFVPNETFKEDDKLSWDEYKISGMCATCQDSVFSSKVKK